MIRKQVRSNRLIGIDTLYYIQATLFIIIVFGVSVSTYYLQERRNIKEGINSSYQHELEVLANNLSYQIDLNKQKLESLSSRTTIKNELYKFYNGEISLEDVKKSTSNKYIDGASVFTNMNYSIRHDWMDRELVYYFSKFSMNHIHDFKDLLIYKYDGEYLLLLKNRIVMDGVYIGYDVASFRFEGLNERDYIYISNIFISKQPQSQKSNSNFIEIGDSGYYLNSTLDPGSLGDEFKANMRTIVLNSLYIVLLLVVISYFTIFKLFKSLINKITEQKEVDIVVERSSAFRQVSSGMAHDFNNILMGILGSIELIRLEGDLSTSINQKLDSAYNRGIKAKNLIQQLLDYTRRDNIDLSYNELDKILRDVVTKYKKSGIIFEIENTLNNRVFVKVDPALMRSVFKNLIQNSIEANATKVIFKFSYAHNPPGTTCPVCKSDIRGYWFLFTVEDNGDGFNDSFDSIKYFEPFFTTKGPKFSGLGLSQVYGFIQLHKGHISLSNSSNNGGVFKIYLSVV